MPPRQNSRRRPKKSRARCRTRVFRSKKSGKNLNILQHPKSTQKHLKHISSTSQHTKRVCPLSTNIYTIVKICKVQRLLICCSLTVTGAYMMSGLNTTLPNLVIIYKIYIYSYTYMYIYKLRYWVFLPICSYLMLLVGTYGSYQFVLT